MGPILDVSHHGDVIAAQLAARAFAREIGFGDAECEQIVLVVTELATNLVRHANGGTLRMSALTDGTRHGILVETEDRGPGIARPDRALTDGFSTAGGLGAGLGTVHRIMDTLELSTPPAGGLHVSARRWVRPSPGAVQEGWFDFGIATRARRHDVHNGDAFVLRRWERGALAGVIDGLGHGPHAERAAQAARTYVEDHFETPLAALFKGVAQVCRNTRGVVMSLARFTSPREVELAAVGNVEVRLFHGVRALDLVVRRGILGVNAPGPVVATHPWTKDTILVIHSDGLRTHWGVGALSQEVWDAPDQAAHALLTDLGKDDDDATVMVVRSAGR